MYQEYMEADSFYFLSLEKKKKEKQLSDRKDWEEVGKGWLMRRFENKSSRRLGE